MNKKVYTLALLIGAIWFVSVVNILMGSPLNQYGIRPRSISGLPGVILWPFLHGGFWHLISNTVPLLVLGGFVLVRSQRLFFQVTIFCVLGGGVGVWLFGRGSTHIGASGLVFGYFGYIVAHGYYERSARSVLIAVAVTFFYGGMIWGVLPTNPYISWEGHLFGMLAGVLFAKIWGRSKGTIQS